jgi:hypothetical protein
MTETRTAVMLMGYGTPRTRADILPYYTDIRRGNPPTEQQLADLTARYGRDRRHLTPRRTQRSPTARGPGGARRANPVGTTSHWA